MHDNHLLVTLWSELVLILEKTANQEIVSALKMGIEGGAGKGKGMKICVLLRQVQVRACCGWTKAVVCSFVCSVRKSALPSLSFQ